MIKLLSHFDGLDGSQNFIEETGNHPLTALGNAQLNTTINKFPTASVKVVPNTDAVIFDQHPDFDFGTGNFTFDFWVYPILLNTWNALIHMNAHYGYYVRVHSSGYVQQLISVNGSSWAYVDSSAAGLVSAGAWSHIACVKNDFDWRVYVNGVSAVYRTNINPMSYNVTRKNGIGSEASGAGVFPANNGLNGYQDELRITDQAEWIEDFPVPTEPYSLEGIPIGILNFNSQLTKNITDKSRLIKVIKDSSQVTKEMKFLPQITKAHRQ
jgi:hypothetical protein